MNTKYPGTRYIWGHQNRGVRRKTVVQTYRGEQRDGKLESVHRKRAERALGKPLPKQAVVHHADGSIDAEAPLVICENQAYHRFLHFRMRIVRAGGNPNTDKVCSDCGKAKHQQEFYRNFNYCRDCTRIHNSAEYKRQRKAG